MLFGQIGLKTEFSVGVSIYIRPKFRHFRPKLVLLRRWIWMKADLDNPELDPRFSQLWIEITWINQLAAGVIKLNGCVNVGCLQLCLLPLFIKAESNSPPRSSKYYLARLCKKIRGRVVLFPVFICGFSINSDPFLFSNVLGSYSLSFSFFPSPLSLSLSLSFLPSLAFIFYCIFCFFHEKSFWTDNHFSPLFVCWRLILPKKE